MRGWVVFWCLLVGAVAAQDSATLYSRAVRALYAKDYVQARVLAEEILQIKPESARGHAVLGQVHLWAEGDLAQADYHLTRARTLIESNHTLPLPKGELRKLHQSLLQALRKARFDRGLFADSLDILDFHDRLYKPRLIHLRGWPLIKMGRLEEARQEMELARASLDPSDPRLVEVLDTLGQVFYEQGEPGKALDLFEQAWLLAEEVSDQPDPAYLTNAGEVARDLNRLKLAEDHWQTASEWPHPYTYAAPLDHLALLFAAQGRFEEAFAALDRSRQWRAQLQPAVAAQTRARHLTDVALVLVAAGDSELAVATMERTFLERPGQAKNSSVSELLEARRYFVYAAALGLEAGRLQELGQYGAVLGLRARRLWAQNRASALAATVPGGFALMLTPYGPGCLNAPWLRTECRAAWGASVADQAGWEGLAWNSPLSRARILAQEGKMVEAMAVDAAVARRQDLSLGVRLEGPSRVSRAVLDSPRFHAGADFVLTVASDMSARLVDRQGRVCCEFGGQSDLKAFLEELHLQAFRAPLARPAVERAAVTEEARPSRAFSKKLRQLLGS